MKDLINNLNKMSIENESYRQSKINFLNLLISNKNLFCEISLKESIFLYILFI